MSLGSTTLDAVSTAPANRLSTLPEWPWDPLDSAAPMTLGYHAWAWAEGSLGEFHRDSFLGLVQPNGPRAGLKFRYTPDQIRFLLWWYAIDEEGDWLFRHGVRRLAKGSGKSPFAGLWSLTEFCAPVRLDRKDSRIPGGVRGRPVDMPLVQIAATAESQTANTMRMVRAFAPKGSPIVQHYGLDPGKTRYYKQPEGTLEVITSSVTASEGAESSAAVEDETEHWRPSNNGPELASTLEDNLAKSGARSIETSNAWVPGIECVAESTWDAWVAQEEGRLRGSTKILYDARVAPPDVDLGDYESLQSALRWVYGDCDWKRGADGEIDVKAQIERIWSPTSAPSESRRKYLNQPTVHEESWTTPAAWAVLADRSRVISPTEPVVLFFDGSRSRDATAIVGCCVSDGHVFTVGIWEPDPRHDAVDVVPIVEVDATLQYAFDTMNVVAFFGDVNEWESFVKVDWPERFGARLRLWASHLGKDVQPIAWDMRGHVYDFTRAVELVEAEINEAGFTHDDNPGLARHVANCRRRPNRWGVSVGKASPSSPAKIDAAVCMVGARMVRRLVLALPEVPELTMPRRIR